MHENRELLPPTATHVGFVGSKKPMTPAQTSRVYTLLVGFGAVEVHMGGRVGADEQMHELADRARLWRMVHPASTSPTAPACTGDVVFPAKPDSDRYHDIVDAAGVLIAAPESAGERGCRTWVTIAHALGAGCPVVIVYPSGRAVRFGRPAGSIDRRVR